MWDVEYAKLALYVVVANITVQITLTFAFYLFNLTRRQIAESKLEKLLSDPQRVPCGITFHCRCDEPQGHLKTRSPHISREHLVAWHE